MEERGGAGQHKGAGSCGFAQGRWRITGWVREGNGGGQRGGMGVEETGRRRGGETRESESQNGSWGGKMGVKGGCEGETAQHKKAYSWSGLFLRRRGHFRK